MTSLGYFGGGVLLASPAIASLRTAHARHPLYEAAKREGFVSIYSVLGSAAAEPLLRDFEAAYPGIKVEYDGEGGSYDVDARFRNEIANKTASADIVWSSAMDMQMLLVKDGYAARYRSPELRHFPHNAHFKSQAFATTIEPVVFVYNRQLLSDVPRSHAELLTRLKSEPERFRGKVTGFDPLKSGVGRMFLHQDLAASCNHASLLETFKAIDFVPSGGTGDMLAAINSGQYLLGYNMMGAHALRRSMMDLTNLGIVYPSDYMLALARVAIISRHARNPNAARLWLDYMLSARGQQIIASQTSMHSLRDGVDANLTAARLRREAGAGLWAIPLDMRLTLPLAPTSTQNGDQAWLAGRCG